MALTAYPGLLGDRGTPFLNTAPMLTSGRIWFVSNTNPIGSNQAAGDDSSRPFSTLAYALGRCRANRGDYIVVMPGHAETITTSIAMSTAGVTVVGLGMGYARPAFTSSGAIDLINVTGANCRLENLRLAGATGATALINIAAAGLEVNNCVLEHGAGPLDAVTIPTGGDRFTFDNCQFIGTAAGPDNAFAFEVGSSSITRWQVTNTTFNYLASAGVDASIFLATADAAPGGLIMNCVAVGLDAGALFVDFNSSVSVGEGMIVNCFWQHRAAATIANGVDLGGYGTSWATGGSDGPVRTANLPATTAS